MADSSNDMVEVGASDGRQMCGLVGDDGEDDLHEDVAELFGHSVEAPIDVGGDDQEAGGGNKEEDDENSAKRSRPSTSAVWLDFKKLFKKGPKGKKIRYGAKCIQCHKEYSALSSGGTSHLTHHRDKCVKRHEKTCMSQSQISFNPDGSMRNWDYCPMVARTELVRLLARLDVPISMCETDAFEEYIRTAHNPKYVPVSRQATTRDIVKFFTDRKANLLILLVLLLLIVCV
jgi:hypothetical protein